MVKLRRRVTTVEAVQNKGNFSELREFAGDFVHREQGMVHIATHAGLLEVAERDWIVKLAPGNFITSTTRELEQEYEEIPASEATEGALSVDATSLRRESANALQCLKSMAPQTNAVFVSEVIKSLCLELERANADVSRHKRGLSALLAMQTNVRDSIIQQQNLTTSLKDSYRSLDFR